MKKLKTPISVKDIKELKVGDMVELSGDIFTGGDAVLPKLVELINNDSLSDKGIDLEGSVIFHTAVSPAGVGPTSSNKLEIEGNIPALSKAGVRIHLGKGKLKQETIQSLKDNDSVYAVMPPVTALLEDRTLERSVVAFEEEGMEAFHKLNVKGFPIIIAAAGGKSIY